MQGWPKAPEEAELRFSCFFCPSLFLSCIESSGGLLSVCVKRRVCSGRGQQTVNFFKWLYALDCLDAAKDKNKGMVIKTVTHAFKFPRKLTCGHRLPGFPGSLCGEIQFSVDHVCLVFFLIQSHYGWSCSSVFLQQNLSEMFLAVFLRNKAGKGCSVYIIVKEQRIFRNSLHSKRKF